MEVSLLLVPFSALCFARIPLQIHRGHLKRIGINPLILKCGGSPLFRIISHHFVVNHGMSLSTSEILVIEIGRFHLRHQFCFWSQHGLHNSPPW